MTLRTVQAAQLSVCENGHLVTAGPSAPKTQRLNYCGHWCWLDALYCSTCGEEVLWHPEEKKP